MLKIIVILSVTAYFGYRLAGYFSWSAINKKRARKMAHMQWEHDDERRYQVEKDKLDRIFGQQSGSRKDAVIALVLMMTVIYAISGIGGSCN